MSLKIVQITPYYHPSIGGVEFVAKYISEELVKRGHFVKVFTANRNHKGMSKFKVPSFEIINGVEVHRFKSQFNIGHISVCPDMYKELRRNKVDIIHLHGYRHPHNEIAYLVNKHKSVPIVLHGHSPFIESQFLSFKKKVFYGSYDFINRRRLSSKISHFIALTEFEKNRYIKLGVEFGKISIIPNAASDECFETIDPKPFIKKHSLAEKRIILFIGNLNRAKRPDILIKAIHRIKDKIPNIFLLIVGPDEGSYKELEKLAIDLNVQKYYKWLGPLYENDKSEAFASAEVFILPSDMDALPLVLVEAMAYGLPVISTDAIGPKTIIEDGKSGLLVKRGDVDGIAEATIKLLSNEGYYTKIAKYAKSIAEKKYKVSSVVDKIEKIYLRLLPHYN